MAKPVVDKWKTKKSFEIVAPPLFKGAPLGETFSSNPKTIPGRVIEKNLADLTGNPKQQRIKLRFRVESVQGELAKTVFLGHCTTQDYERSLIRRRTSKVYTNQSLLTKDNKSLKVKVFLITLEQVNKAVKQDLRLKLNENLKKEAAAQNLDDFLNLVLSGKLSSKLKSALHKVYPLRHVVIQKTEL